MRMTSILSLAFLSAAILAEIQQAHAESRPIEGVVSDTRCGQKHMLPGKTDAECIQECLKGKASYALVVGANVYTLEGKPQTIGPFACKHVKVMGTLRDLTLTVISIRGMQ